MTLPDADADVDVDDLIDDDEGGEEKGEEEDEEPELAADELTADEDEQHPITSSSSSPPTAQQVDDVSAATDTADSDNNVNVVSDNNVTSPPTATCPSNEGGDDIIQDHDTDKTSELLLTELQQQQESSTDSDDVKATTAGEPSDDLSLPEQSLTTDELQTEDSDASRQRDGGEIVDEDLQSPDNDYRDSSAENQQESSAENEEKVAVNSSDIPEANQQVDTPDTNQQVCQLSAIDSNESHDVIPTASSASAAETATISLQTAVEQAQHAEVVDERQPEHEMTSEDQEKDKEDDVKCATETTDQTETEQNEHGVAVESDQNALQVINQSELQVKNDHESDSLNTLAEELDHSICTAEKPPSVHDETTTDLDKPSLSTSDDEVTSQQDAEVGHDEVKVVTEEVKVTEEAKVTYEASAKQLDLLSRLAMLREKAAQRKAQQPSDTESMTQDSCETTPGPSTHSDDSNRPQSTRDDLETTSGEHDGPSTHRDDSVGHHDQSDGLKQLQQHDAPHTSTKTDVYRRSIDTDKETLSETNRQEDISTVDADAKQETTAEVTESHGVTLSKTEPGELLSEIDGRRCDAIVSPSVITHDDTVITEARRESSDNNSVQSAEHTSLSSTDKSTTKVHSPTRQGVSTAELLNNDINVSTGEAADVNKQLQQTQHSRNTEFCSATGTAIDAADELQSADEGVDQSALSQARSDTGHGEIYGTATAVDVDVQSVRVHSDSENTTDQTASDTELRGAVTVATHPGDDQLEPTMSLSDTSSVTRRLTESSSETTCPPDNDTADNYDSDLDLEFADRDALQLLSDIQTLKSSKTDGPGYLYIFADHPRGRFKIGASRSPAKRLRQASTFNPDITSLVFLPVSRRLAAVEDLRQRLFAKDPGDVIPGSRDWFTGSDDVMTEQVRQVAAASTTNKA